MNEVTKKSVINRNCSIDIFRIFCAFSVVAVHAHPFKEINSSLYFFFCEISSRIAVPFFFTVIGYYFFKKLENGISVISYIKKLFKDYLFWSAVYSVIFIFLKILNKSDVSNITKGLISGFLFYGISEHLWFFPALFIGLFVILILYKLNLKFILVPLSIFIYTINILSTAYSEIAAEIPFFYIFTSIDYRILRTLTVALPYLSLGLILNVIKTQKINNFVLKIFLIFSIGFYITEKLIIEESSLGRSSVNCFSLYILIFFIMLILIKNPAKKYKRAAHFSKITADFIYFAHPVFLEIIRFILPQISGFENRETLYYILTCFLTCSAGYFKFKNRNFFNKSFK